MRYFVTKKLSSNELITLKAYVSNKRNELTTPNALESMLEATATMYILTPKALIDMIDAFTAPIKHNTHVEKMDWTIKAYTLTELVLSYRNEFIQTGKTNLKEYLQAERDLAVHLQSTPQAKMLPCFMFDKNVNVNKLWSTGANGWSDSSRKCKTSDNPKHNRIMECQYKIRTIPNDAPEAYYFINAQYPVHQALELIEAPKVEAPKAPKGKTTPKLKAPTIKA
jgi:hypothetical protein